MELDPIWQPAQQQKRFRRLLDAMARPGTVQHAGDIGKESDAVLAVLAVLLDQRVTLSDPHALIADTARPLLQAATALPSSADYLVCDGSRPIAENPKLGDLDSPEISCTLVIKVTSLEDGPLHLDLSGPGIAGSRRTAIAGLAQEWIEMRNRWCADFPLGLDLLLVDENRLMALPRTTRVGLV